MFCCKYCLNNDNFQDIICSCKCIDNFKFAHKECIKEWFDKKNSQFVFPGKINQFNTCCELCRFDYNIIFYDFKIYHSLTKDLLFYFLLITCNLALLYLILGLFVKEIDICLINFSDYWLTVFTNGIILTHLGVFSAYLFIILAVSYHTGICERKYIYLILSSVLVIYFDVIERVIQRHRNRSKVIKDILEEF